MLIAALLALSGCASQPVVQAVQTPCPKVPEPPAALMRPIPSPFQLRVRELLQSWQQMPIESEIRPSPGSSGQ